MSDLIAIAYPDQATAERVRGRLTEAIKAKVIEVDDAVVVTRSEDGKVKLHQSTSTAGVGAAGGALWGGLIGLLFLAPLLGMAVGAAAGAAGGALADYGVDDSFMKELGEKLTPGSAALIVLVRNDDPRQDPAATSRRRATSSRVPCRTTPRPSWRPHWRPRATASSAAFSVQGKVWCALGTKLSPRLGRAVGGGGGRYCPGVRGTPSRCLLRAFPSESDLGHRFGRSAGHVPGAIPS